MSGYIWTSLAGQASRAAADAFPMNSLAFPFSLSSRALVNCVSFLCVSKEIIYKGFKELLEDDTQSVYMLCNEDLLCSWSSSPLERHRS